ncbi:MAG: hypothetical protein KF768_13305 [Phycisphaeraceae bacterium]|nr:hypothetical protein [Phycisphaeraceae bacterium]
MARLPRTRDLSKHARTAREDREASRTLRFERRREEREAVEADKDGRLPRLTATYSNGQDRFGILHMELVDQSRSGLGVRSKTAVEPGMRVTICPAGSTVPWLSAVAVRCEAEGGEGGGHRIGLALSPRFAA